MAEGKHKVRGWLECAGGLLCRQAAGMLLR